MSSDLPRGWVCAQLDQVFEPRSTRVAPSDFPESPYIGMEHVEGQTNRLIGTVKASTMSSSAARFFANDVLYGRMGVPKITRIGGCINDGSVALLDVDEPFKIYLYWFLRTQTKRLRALNQGAAQPNLNTDIVRKICVPICTSKEMARINTLLDKTVDAVRLQELSIERGLAQAAAQRKNILKAAFAGQLVPQDPNDEPTSAMLERIRAERDNQKHPSTRAHRTKQPKRPVESDA